MVAPKQWLPYPIFCCMLCHMWEWLTESKRERVRKLETFSQFITEMINALVEQYASKLKDEKESLKDCQIRCKESFERIGKVAFRGLLVRQLTFYEEEFSRMHGRNADWLRCRGTIVKEEHSRLVTLDREMELNIFLRFHFLTSSCKNTWLDITSHLFTVKTRMAFEKLLTKKVLPDKYEEFRYSPLLHCSTLERGT